MGVCPNKCHHIWRGLAYIDPKNDVHFFFKYMNKFLYMYLSVCFTAC